MNKKTVFLSLLVTPTFAFASTTVPDLVAGSLRGAADIVQSDLQTYGIRILASLMLIQFTISNIKLIGQAADLDRVFAKLAGSLLWFTFCYIVMFNGSSFLYSGIDSFLQKAAGWTSASGYFSSIDLVANGIDMFSNLMVAVKNTSNRTDFTSILTILGVLPALLTLVVGIIIIFSAGLIAVKILMIKVETAIVVAMSPLSFSLLGLDALRDQGIAPFKYLIALIYRIVVLAMTVTGMKSISDNLVQALNNMQCVGDVCDPWSPVLAAAFGYTVMAFIAYKSDAIAAQLASGSSSFSSGDMASAVASGVAAGMAVASGGAAAMAAASAGKQSIGDFAKSAASTLGGEQGTEMLASGSGKGEPNIAPPPPIPTSNSNEQSKLGSQNSGTGNTGASIGNSPQQNTLKSLLNEALGNTSDARRHSAHEGRPISAHINTNGD